MTYEDGKINTERYWAPKFNPTDQSLEEIVEEIDQVVRESIHVLKIIVVKVGSFLSSGVDSSYVTSVLKPKKTVTVGFGNQSFPEIDNAKKLSNELGIDNNDGISNPDLCFEKFEDIQYMMDEPHSDPSIVPLYFLSELTSRDVKAFFLEKVLMNYSADTKSTIRQY
jgi:asparagine synthase (glutamine-hydrolysing)